MAIDTAAKRFSMMNFISGNVLPVPSGSFDQGDRQTFLGLYSGILAAAGALIPAIQGYLYLGGKVNFVSETEFTLFGCKGEFTSPTTFVLGGSHGTMKTGNTFEWAGTKGEFKAP